jgi:predicted RNase H-like nuclease (RuvC/YqgF family)
MGVVTGDSRDNAGEIYAGRTITMDADQLQRLATDARLNYWPPHLGVKTDAEKVEYLAQRIEETADMGDVEIERLENQVEMLGNETVDLENKLAARDIKIERLEDEIERLNGKIVDLQERCAELGERQ